MAFLLSLADLVSINVLLSNLETENAETISPHVTTPSTARSSLLESWKLDSFINKYQHVLPSKSSELFTIVSSLTYSKSYKTRFAGKYRFD